MDHLKTQNKRTVQNVDSLGYSERGEKMTERVERRVKTSVTIEKELLKWAHDNGVNMSFELRKALKDKREREERQ